MRFGSSVCPRVSPTDIATASCAAFQPTRHRLRRARRICVNQIATQRTKITRESHLTFDVHHQRSTARGASKSSAQRWLTTGHYLARFRSRYRVWLSQYQRQTPTWAPCGIRRHSGARSWCRRSSFRACVKALPHALTGACSRPVARALTPSTRAHGHKLAPPRRHLTMWERLRPPSRL
jgi:hypothetical protein